MMSKQWEYLYWGVVGFNRVIYLVWPLRRNIYNINFTEILTNIYIHEWSDGITYESDSLINARYGPYIGRMGAISRFRTVQEGYLWSDSHAMWWGNLCLRVEGWDWIHPRFSYMHQWVLCAVAYIVHISYMVLTEKLASAVFVKGFHIQ